MNRNATAAITESGESLVRLAEIAEALSGQQQTAELPRSALVRPVFMPNPFVAASAALRKRGPEGQLSSDASPDAKRGKIEDKSATGVQFREYQAEIWSEKFEDLCEYRKCYGNCHVPHNYTKNAALAQWVKRQRYQYMLKTSGKRSTLSDDRVRLLNKIGFIWNSHDAVWEERWNELLQFKRVHGHCNVPSKYEENPSLAIWVKRQRRHFKFYCEKKGGTGMTPERIAKLQKLGFSWDRRKDKGYDSAAGDTILSSPTPSASSGSLTDSTGLKTTSIVSTKGKSSRPAAKLPACEFFSFSHNF